MRLRDRLTSNYSGNNSSRNKPRNICYKYNRGRCTFGFNCKFDHKCAICGKWGHGAFYCRKASGAEHEKYFDNETGETSTRYKSHEDKQDKYRKDRGNGGNSRNQRR